MCIVFLHKAWLNLATEKNCRKISYNHVSSKHLIYVKKYMLKPSWNNCCLLSLEWNFIRHLVSSSIC